MSARPYTPGAMQPDLEYIEARRAQREAKAEAESFAAAGNQAMHYVNEAVELIEAALHVDGLEHGPYTTHMAAALALLGRAESDLAARALAVAEGAI